MIKCQSLLLGLLARLIAGGCGGTSDNDGEDITGGISLELGVRKDENSFSLYSLQKDGTLTFAGGNDARSRHPSWTGAITAEQANEVTALVREAGWLDREPAKGNSKDSIKWEVKLQGPKGKRSFTAYGDRPEFRAVADELDELARARFEEYLKTMPKPGPQPK